MIKDNEEKEKKRRKRLSKKERYEKEREELIKEIEKKIGLTEDKRGVFLYELEENEGLKEYLKENVEEIKKIYKCGTWGYFTKEEKQGMGNEIGLLKSIYKNSDYIITSKRKNSIKDSVKKLYVEIYFHKK